MADEVESKIGLYICSGCEIGKAVNTDKLVEVVEEEGGAEVVKVHEFLCSDDAVNMIKADISSLGLNRVVITACSGRINSDVFNFGPEVYFELEDAAQREAPKVSF